MNLRTKTANLKNYLAERPKVIVFGLIGLFLLHIVVFFISVYAYNRSSVYSDVDGRHIFDPFFESLLYFLLFSLPLSPLILIIYGLSKLRRGETTDETELRRRRAETLKYFAVGTVVVLLPVAYIWLQETKRTYYTSDAFIANIIVVFLSTLLILIFWFWGKYADNKLTELLNAAPLNYLFAIMFLVAAFILYAGSRNDSVIQAFAWLSALVGIGSWVLGYLGKPKFEIKLKELDEKLKDRLADIKELEPTQNETLEATNRFDSLAPRTGADKLDLLHAKLDANNRRLEELLEQSTSFVKKDEILAERATLIRDRLTGELRELTKRGNLNLTIGILTTIAAVGALFWGLIATQPPQGETEVAALVRHYLPRVSFAIFIEVFSFFFLRLYKSSLEDIKYYHNELTNLDSKLLALEIANTEKLSDALTPILLGLLNTDRNFILKTGESTVELERIKTEQVYMRGLLDTMSTKLTDIATFKKG